MRQWKSNAESTLTTRMSGMAWKAKIKLDPGPFPLKGSVPAPIWPKTKLVPARVASWRESTARFSPRKPDLTGGSLRSRKASRIYSATPPNTSLKRISPRFSLISQARAGMIKMPAALCKAIFFEFL